MPELGSDQLCYACAKVDLFSLFTGPRYMENDPRSQILDIFLGTLTVVKSNNSCPLCRLVKHILYESRDGYDVACLGSSIESDDDDARTYCVLHPVRHDEYEETHYQSLKTRDLLATRMQVLVRDKTGSLPGRRLSDVVGAGQHFQLLSPSSINPARPLSNGFQVTTMEKNIQLLTQWFEACCNEHTNTCGNDHLYSMSPLRIWVIDVHSLKVLQRDSHQIQYAALSYVWGQTIRDYLDTSSYRLADLSNAEGIDLPQKKPKVVNDAIYICTRLSIPYLWVDLYCVDQQDPERKQIDIQNMGHIYHSADIVLVDGIGTSPSQYESNGLLPDDLTAQISTSQRVETINGRNYISSLPGTSIRLWRSAWNTRSWTYQEGQMAQRVAFFDSRGIIYLCTGGTWSENCHSGGYGHRAVLTPKINIQSYGYQVLGSRKWLRGTKWRFDEYQTIISAYTRRQVSFESDKLNAISGCFDTIGHRKGVQFFFGMPSIDFHYALLWHWVDDRRRAGFPSWSWTGFHSNGQTHWLWPSHGTSGYLRKRANSEIYKHHAPESLEIDLAGPLIQGSKLFQQPNKSIQRLFPIQLCANTSTIKLTSEVCHFNVSINPLYDDTRNATPRPSTSAQPFFDTDDNYISTAEMRLILHNSSGCHYTDPGFKGYMRGQPWSWMPFRLCLPFELHISTATWLIRDGIDLASVIDIEMVEGTEDSLPTRHVFFLGLDPRDGMTRRCGMGWMTREMWDASCPTTKTVEIS
ncbi:heterokaryon incompatibility protein-domain-containing protein [Xylariaceae sp. FL1272]|nr:heterokaryon incompatibility protein-domain-containing protein [Xylariaceae sp. FL1272]